MLVRALFDRDDTVCIFRALADKGHVVDRCWKASTLVDRHSVNGRAACALRQCVVRVGIVATGRTIVVGGREYVADFCRGVVVWASVIVGKWDVVDGRWAASTLVNRHDVHWCSDIID